MPGRNSGRNSGADIVFDNQDAFTSPRKKAAKGNKKQSSGKEEVVEIQTEAGGEDFDAEDASNEPLQVVQKWEATVKELISEEQRGAFHTECLKLIIDVGTLTHNMYMKGFKDATNAQGKALRSTKAEEAEESDVPDTTELDGYLQKHFSASWSKLKLLKPFDPDLGLHPFLFVIFMLYQDEHDLGYCLYHDKNGKNIEGPLADAFSTNAQLLYGPDYEEDTAPLVADSAAFFELNYIQPVLKEMFLIVLWLRAEGYHEGSLTDLTVDTVRKLQVTFQATYATRLIRAIYRMVEKSPKHQDQVRLLKQVPSMTSGITTSSTKVMDELTRYKLRRETNKSKSKHGLKNSPGQTDQSKAFKKQVKATGPKKTRKFVKKPKRK